MDLSKIIKIENKLFNYAVKITSDENMAKDLIQEMYLKLLLYKDKEVNESYAFTTLKHLIFNALKSNVKTIKIEALDNIAFENRFFNDFDDKEISVLNQVEKLPTRQKEMLKGVVDGSFRSVAQKYNTYAVDVFREVKKAKERVLKGN